MKHTVQVSEKRGVWGVKYPFCYFLNASICYGKFCNCQAQFKSQLSCAEVAVLWQLQPPNLASQPCHPNLRPLGVLIKPYLHDNRYSFIKGTPPLP